MKKVNLLNRILVVTGTLPLIKGFIVFLLLSALAVFLIILYLYFL